MIFWEGLLGLGFRAQAEAPLPNPPLRFQRKGGAKLRSLPLAQPRGGLGRGKLYKQSLTSNRNSALSLQRQFRPLIRFRLHQAQEQQRQGHHVLMVVFANTTQIARAAAA